MSRQAHQQAEHMAAPTNAAETSKKLLPWRRPHMALSVIRHRYLRPLSGGSPEGPTSLRQTCLSVSSRLLVGASAEFGEGGAWFVLGGFTRVQFSPPHRMPRKHPCTRKILELTKLILAE